MSVATDRYVVIDDFSPGIWSAGSWMFQGKGVAGQIVPGAPLGAAQETGTYRCVPLPNGNGLGPAPRGTAATTTASLSSVLDSRFIGITSWPDSSSGFGCNWLLLWSNQSGVPSASVFLVDVINNISQIVSDVFAGSISPTKMGVSLAKTNLSATSPYLTAGNHCIAIAAGPAYTTVPNLGSLKIFPSPAAPAVTGTQAVNSLPVRVFGHQNRIVYLKRQTPTEGAIDTGPPLFSLVCFSDPANSNVFPTAQDQMFDAENQGGFGAYGSLNASTLLLVKDNSGGVIVQGDIASPIITQAPGIQGTGLLHSGAAVCSLGMVYGARYNGVHIWAGGATSTKISNQLRDDFFDAGLTSLEETYYPGWDINFKEWGDYILVSNNWMFHIPTGSWWRIENPSTDTLTFWETSPLKRYAAGTTKTGSGTGAPITTPITWGRTFDDTLGAVNWSWQSQPIPQSINKMLGVDELIVVAQGAGTIVFTLRGYDGDVTGATTVTAPVTVTLPAEAANQPVKIRVPMSALCYNLIVKMVADNGSNNAPTVHSLAIGTTETNLVAVQ